MNAFKAVVLCLILICSAGLAQAQTDDLINVQSEGMAKAESAPEASKAIVAAQTAKVAREQIIQMIGEKSYNKNKNIVENRIVRESFKFIPFLTPGIPEKVGDQWKMMVTMRVSIESLREMISNNGLFFEGEGPATILPMVAIMDRVRGQQYRWWTTDVDEKKTLMPINQTLSQNLFRELNRQGFYVVRPITSTLSTIVPDAFRGDRSRPEDLRFWADLWKAQVIIRGDLRVRESSAISGGYQIAIKLNAVQTNNNRTVAEVVRNFDTESGNQDIVVRSKLQTVLPEVAKDLSSQFVEAWQRGTLGANRLRLTVRGRLTPKQLSDLKTQMTRSVREIKDVRERLMEAGSVIYEVDFAGGGQQLSDKLKTLNIPGLALHLAEVSDSTVALDVRAQ